MESKEHYLAFVQRLHETANIHLTKITLYVFLPRGTLCEKEYLNNLASFSYPLGKFTAKDKIPRFRENNWAVSRK